ncbi:hypothetical protein Btru_075186 [Bulinus truncatus]|nr:hypothetical protein Btru_075186 [Bulinus truncatus]
MAQWVCYTKKMLTSAITHLADELEQTVLDFNDAIHNLSSSSNANNIKDSLPNDGTSRDGQNIVISEPVGHKPLSDVDQPTVQCNNEEEECEHIHPEYFDSLQEGVHRSNIFIKTYHVATTRQPETSGFTSIVTATLSLPSPIKANQETDKNKSYIKQNQQVKCIAPHTFTNCKICNPATSSFSSSQNPEQKISAQLCKSPVSEVIARDSGRQSPLYSFKKTGQFKMHNAERKRPGKVIRTQVSSVFKQDAAETHRYFTPIIENPSQPDDKSNDSRLERINENSEQHTSVSVIIERLSHPTNWLSLSSIGRVLSLAFNQIANMLLTTGDESQLLESDTRSGTRPLSVTYHRSLPINANFDFASQDSFQIIRRDLSPVHPSLLRSTQSCESFEVIEQPADYEIEHCSEYVGQRPFLLRMFSQSSSNSDTNNLPDVQMGTCESSAEFCNFNFKHLVSDRQCNQLNPLPAESISDSDQCHISTSVVLNDEHRTVTSMTNLVCESNDGEAEDTESLTFAVISENEDDDFIILHLTS